jgi:hypothetical protein
MVPILPPFFPHRRNADGSFDSICLKCLLTIAKAKTEAELDRHDKNHVCIPSILSQRKLGPTSRKGGLLRMKYVADYVVSHRGTKHSGTVVLRGEDTPKVGGILAVRFAGLPMPIQIDSVNLRKEMHGIQHATLVCSTCSLSE